MDYSSKENGIQLEPLRAHHADAFAEAVKATADQISRWLDGRLAPRTRDEVTTFITEWEQAWKAGEKYGFVATEISGGRLVGFGLLNHINRTHQFANLGYWIRPEAIGQGYATTITRLLAKFGFNTLELERLELVIEPENTASQRVAEKAGATQEGLLRNRLTVNGEARNAFMYSLVKNDQTI